MDLTETNQTLKEQTVRMARNVLGKNRADVLGPPPGLSLARAQSEGDGYFYDDEGDVSTYWRPGMIPGAAPIKPE